MDGPYLHAPPANQKIVAAHHEHVSDTETQIRKASQKGIDSLERAINLAQRTLVLKNAPGFQPFVKAVEDLRLHAQNEMTGCVHGNEQLRILQGRCQAFSSILALMRDTEQNIDSLGQQLQAARDSAAASIRQDGKVQPQPVGGP